MKFIIILLKKKSSFERRAIKKMNQDEIIAFICNTTVVVKIMQYSDNDADGVKYKKGETEALVNAIMQNRAGDWQNSEYKNLYTAVKKYLFSSVGIGDFMLYTKYLTIVRAQKKRIRRSKKEINYNILTAIGDYSKFLHGYYTPQELEEVREGMYTIDYITYFGFINQNEATPAVDRPIISFAATGNPTL